jgi:osmotically-inducible protein OsmY
VLQVFALSARRPEAPSGRATAIPAAQQGRDGTALAALRRGLLAVSLAVSLVGALAFPGIATAQANAASSGASPSATNTGPTGGAPAPPVGLHEEAVTPAKTASASAASAPKAPAHRSHKGKRAPAKPPGWVIQSKVQLALESDPRFKNVRATMTQPGVIVLEGQVFDDDAKTSAQQTAAGVEGVNRVINALTTNSLQWLQAQNRIGQALQRNGLPLVSVKVIGKTAYLSGQVRSDLEKDKAAQVVTSTEPDITVGTNLINVVP